MTVPYLGAIVSAGNAIVRGVHMTSTREFLTSAGFASEFVAEMLHDLAAIGEDGDDVFLPYDDLVLMFEGYRIDFGLPPFPELRQAAE